MGGRVVVFLGCLRHSSQALRLGCSDVIFPFDSILRNQRGSAMGRDGSRSVVLRRPRYDAGELSRKRRRLGS